MPKAEMSFRNSPIEEKNLRQTRSQVSVYHNDSYFPNILTNRLTGSIIKNRVNHV
jgi:hypothetical protein